MDIKDYEFMRRRSVFLILFLIVFAGIGWSHQSAAQGYFLKKNDNKGFFSRLFGGGDKKQDDSKNTSEKIVKPKPQKTRAQPSSLPKQENVVNPRFDSDPPLEELNIEEMQKSVMGECTEEDRAAYERFNQEMDNPSEDVSKKESFKKLEKRMLEEISPRDFREFIKLSKGGDERAIEKKAQEIKLEEKINKVFNQNPELETDMQDMTPQDGIMGLLSQKDEARASVLGAMRCKSWKEVPAERKALKEERDKKKKK